ncbi:MAG: hypothetical protein R3D57_14750 [Hyphomicrobiaceae bacterium]
MAAAAGHDLAIESTELPPIDGGTAGSSDAGPGQEPAPADVDSWLGLPLATVERVTATMPRTLDSPMLAALWRQLLKGGRAGNQAALAFRAQRLIEAGWVADAAQLLSATEHADPLTDLLEAQANLAIGDGAGACPILKRIPTTEAVRLGKARRADYVAMAAYCAALSRDQTQAALAAEIMRETGADRPIALAVLDQLSGGSTPSLPTAGGADLIDMRFISLIRPVGPSGLGERPQPDLAAAYAADATLDAEDHAAAIEQAFAAHLVQGPALADAYRAIEIDASLKQNPLAQDADGTLRRAVLFQAAFDERAMLRKARYIRASLDEMSREGLGHLAAGLLADAVTELPQVGEIGWFAPTAVEILVAAGRTDAAAEWIRRDAELDPLGNRLGLGHWLLLSRIAGSSKTETDIPRVMGELERAVRAGVFPPDLLQRLVTVLDALEYAIPIPVWDAAGKDGQSDLGQLPETGLLTELQEATKALDRPRVVLLTVLALAKGGPGGAHQLALGDSIRALKRVGMEREARQLAFEALYPAWPRRAGG